jgi:hypothetical protein
MGRPRPEGYKFEIQPREAAVVVRVFRAYADGHSVIRIVRMLNETGVPGRIRSSKGWSPATVSRLLDNAKYIGRWVWNKKELRRDPRTGRRRAFPKPESEWIIHEGESLRIVPQDLWERVRARRKEVRGTGPADQGAVDSLRIRKVGRNISPRTCSPERWSAAGAVRRWPR